MKKFLYGLIILLNGIGSILSLSLFIFAGSFSFQNLFLVITCSVIFIMSLTITILDYNHSFRAKNKCKIYRFERKVKKNEVVIDNYKDYFTSKRFDFTIA